MQNDYAKQYAKLYREHWWWRSREAAVIQTIGRLTDLPEHAKILDVGCGDALSLPVLSSLSKDAQAWGIEIDPNTINPDNPLYHRIYQKPLGDPIYDKMSFDLITALDVIEHIEDDQAAVDNMMNMLKPGGWLVITVPAMPMLWTKHDEINIHYRRYKRKSLNRILKHQGQVIDCRYLYTSLTLPKLALAVLGKINTNPTDVPKLPAGWINQTLKRFFNAELALNQRVQMPVGTSLMATVRKPVHHAVSRNNSHEIPHPQAA